MEHEVQMSRLLASLALAAFALTPAYAQDVEDPTDSEEVQAIEPPMTIDRLAEIVFALDPNAQSQGASFQMIINEIPLVIITDPIADRMRVMTPVTRVGSLSGEQLMRVMQANFDTALDARYAIAQGTLWSTYIHPLSPLEKDQFISGLGQTVNLAQTFGTLYTGGAQSFAGGDSAPLQQQLIQNLLQQGEEI